MDVRNCLSCAKPISGRADKKYCDNQCRNDHNNKLYGKSNSYIRKINRILKNNRNILEQLTPEGSSAKIKGKELQKLGFSFEYYTNTYTTKKENVYYFCYEFGYLPVENNFFVLVHRTEYLQQ